MLNQKIETIDNLFFMMDESYKKVKKDFDKMFVYNKEIRGYLHENGAIIGLRNYVPELALSQLSKKEKRKCGTSYNLGGIVHTPLNGNFGVIIPTFQSIVKYCYKNKINAGFSSIEGNGKINYYDPKSKVQVPWDCLDRREISWKFLKKDRRKHYSNRLVRLSKETFSVN